MVKKRSKTISILLVLTFLFTMIMPGLVFAGTYADASYSTAQGVDTDTTALGFVKLDDFTDCDVLYITVELPDGVEFDTAYEADPTAHVDNDAGNPAAVVGSPDEDSFTVTVGAAGDEFDADWVKIDFASDMVIKSSAPDDIEVTVTIQASEDNGGGDQVLAWGPESFECLIGVQGDAEITVDAASAKSVSVGSEQEIAKITFEESMAGALAVGDLFELELPDGFEWDYDSEGNLDAGPYGLDGTAYLKGSALDPDGDNELDEQILIIEIETPSDPFADELEFSGLIKVYPDADEGDVEVDITSDFVGGADFDDCSVTAAYIGTSSGIITVEDDQEDNVFIGQLGAAADTFTIETTGGQFRAGDDIILTLSGGALWAIEGDEDLSGDWGEIGAFLASEDLDWIGSYNDGSSIWLQVPDDASYDEIEFSNIPLLIIPYYLGTDITVSLRGTYESADPVVVASPTVHAEFTAEKKAVQISALNQAAGDIIITETQKDAFASLLGDDASDFIFLELPTGVYFSDEPTIEVNGDNVEVTLYSSYDYDFNNHEGNGLGATNLSSIPGPDYDGAFSAGSDTLFINFENAGSDFSANKIDTISISDIAYDFDTRYSTVGDITVKAGGRLLNDWMSVSSASGQELVKTPMYSVVNATARDADSASSTFVIGASTYIINGVEYTMDAAPYISGDRTYMPIRFVAYSLGITDSDILWDGAAQTVTLMKGDKVVQLKVGSTELLINGASVTMDAAPEITNDRVCLPIRFVAQAFGASVGWDEALQTVSINM